MGMSALEVRRRVMLAQPHEAVASGAVASFRTDVVSALPMEFDLVPIQAGTGDPSPENVRPITGHDGFTRTGTGKNLFDKTIGTTNGIRGDDGTHSSSSTSGYTDAIGGFLPNTEYTFNGTFAGSNQVWRIYYLDGRKNWIKRTGTISSSNVPYTIITPENCRYVQIQYIRASANFNTIQIVKGESVGEYEAYKGTYIETTFPTPPGTIYGGHVVDNGDGTGTLTVTKARKVFNGGASESWVKNSTHGYYTVLSSSYDYNFTPTFNYLGAISPGDGSGLAVWQGRMNKPSGSVLMLVKPDLTLYPDVPSWKNYLQSNNLVAILNLAEPQVYTLSMTAIQSLIGQNNIWVDNADSVSVEYWGH